MGKHEDADLILKLYDLRREPVMREARNWFFAFNPQTAGEYMEALMGEHSGHLRMVVSYWDMAASFAVAGALNPASTFSSSPRSNRSSKSCARHGTRRIC